ncbi:hypothetical protein [Bacillus pacificus]|uniref:hypothetical protein n=1 Tax=Bacillus pacificus TaxID=2026187 RepID=UPI00178C72BA|nr:hypothetical protein [Bacillus pacificus]
MRMRENKVNTISLIDELTNAELQRECSECRELKLADDFQKYTEGHLRAQCRECNQERQREVDRKRKLQRRIKNFNDRALEKGLEGDFTVENYNELLAFSQGRCMVTDEELTPETAQLDHVIALSKQMVGSTASNVWIVHKRVNEKKWIYSLTDYLKSEHGREVVDINVLINSIGYLAKKADLTTQEYIDLLVSSEHIAQVSKEFFNN